MDLKGRFGLEAIRSRHRKRNRELQVNQKNEINRRRAFVVAVYKTKMDRLRSFVALRVSAHVKFTMTKSRRISKILRDRPGSFLPRLPGITSLIIAKSSISNN
jgi:hypothetical protein